MPSDAVRTILPLALVTGTAMLAMDLYLPAVPAMQRGLATSVAMGQATVAVFLAGLAASQLLWGIALHRAGPRACVRAGLVLLVLASFGCALAPGIEALLVLRFVQGVAAGASTVVAPSVIRATLPDHEAVRGIAAIAMIESLVPAAGPVLGTLLLQVLDWRWTFVLIGAAALAATPFVLRATPPRLPGGDAGVATGYRVLLADARYAGAALAHALAFAALLCFVASAPQVLADTAAPHGAAFATTQVCGVAAFIAAASRAGRVNRRWGPRATVLRGAWAHALLCSAFLAVAAWWPLNLPVIIGFWMLFCGVFGVRGPAGFSDALAVAPAQMGRASALLVLALLAAGAAATQAVAPFLAQHGVVAVAAAMALLAWGSLALAGWRWSGAGAAGVQP